MKRSLFTYTFLLLLPLCAWADERLPYPLDTIGDVVYYRYTVEKSIGLYRISKNFGVTQEAILNANPDLRTRGLRYEEVILIPTSFSPIPEPTPIPAPTEVPAQPVAEQPKVQRTFTLSHRQEERVHSIAPQAIALQHNMEQAVLPNDSADALQTDSLTAYITDTFRIAMLLPLQASTLHRTTTIDRFYDFYAGALLAFKHNRDSLWRDSTGMLHMRYYEVRTFDIEKGESHLQALLNGDELVNVDAIIGPAYSAQVARIAPFAQEHHIHTIVPFISSIPAVRSNPYIWQFNPSDLTETHALINALDTLRQDINIVLVDAPNSDLPASVSLLRDSITTRQLPVTHTTIRQILADSIGFALQDSVENIILFHSERYSNIQLLMPYLLSGKQDKRLTLLSHYAWQNEHILLPQLYTGIFYTPNSEQVAGYADDFAAYFGHTLASHAPRYDLLGYDLTSFLLHVLPDMRSGDLTTALQPYYGLQSTILFAPINNGGYENQHIIIQRK